MIRFNFEKFGKWLTDYKFDLEHDTKKHISTRKIAEKTGLSHPTISRALSGKSLDIDSILTLCDWMGSDVNDFRDLNK